MEIKNFKKAAARILKAVQKDEKIILYGDADLDGMGSVIILQETIRTLGGKTTAVYFPDRETEGYGISLKGLRELKKFAPALLISLDCGITNFKEIRVANKLGFEVMLIDHHQVLDKLPSAKIIVDPHQKGDKSPFKDFATAGIAFKLSEIILKGKIHSELRKNFLELTAIATLADMMPKTGENKLFIEDGLLSLRNSWRPGFKAFFDADFLRDYNSEEKVSKIISILNVREIENDLPVSFLLLTSPSLEDARLLVERLFEKNKVRKQRLKGITEELEERVSKNDEPIIFEGGADFDFTLISSVASSLAQTHQKPTFIYKKLSEESMGTVRVPAGVDSVALMKKCQRHLLAFGGHAKASGFRLKNKNLEKFKECLTRHYRHEKDNNLH